MGDATAGFAERLAVSAAAATEREQERIADLLARGVQCFKCEDTGRERGTFYGSPFCTCPIGEALSDEDFRRRRMAAYNALPRELSVPARFASFTFDTFPEQSSATLQALREWVASERDPRVPGLFLYGNFGRGKTGLIVATLRELVWRDMESDFGFDRWYDMDFSTFGRFVTGTGFLESLRPRSGYDDSADSVRSYQRVKYLAFDDLGAERFTEWGIDRLFEVVNYRHSELMAMLVTSNLSPGDLAKRINKQIGDQSGDRIVERLLESCTIIRFDEREPNWRIAR